MISNANKWAALLGSFMLLTILPARPLWAQTVTRAPSGEQLQLGLGLDIAPGIGVQVGYVSASSFYTRELILIADLSPSFWGGEDRVLLTGSLGAAIRILGIGRTIGNTTYRGYDIDVGFRFGPGLFFAFNETRTSKNRRFTLFLEPFVRYTKMVSSGRVYFLEIGLQRSILRGGLWLTL